MKRVQSYPPGRDLSDAVENINVIIAVLQILRDTEKNSFEISNQIFHLNFILENLNEDNITKPDLAKNLAKLFKIYQKIDSHIFSNAQWKKSQESIIKKFQDVFFNDANQQEQPVFAQTDILDCPVYSIENEKYSDEIPLSITLATCNEKMSYPDFSYQNLNKNDSFQNLERQRNSKLDLVRLESTLDLVSDLYAGRIYVLNPQQQQDVLDFVNDFLARWVNNPEILLKLALSPQAVEAGFNLIGLINKNYKGSIVEFKKGIGFPDKETASHQANSDADENLGLKSFDACIPVKDTQREPTIPEMLAEGVSAKALLNSGISLKKLMESGITKQALVSEGIYLSDLLKPYRADTSNLSVLTQIGFELIEIRNFYKNDHEPLKGLSLKTRFSLFKNETYEENFLCSKIDIANKKNKDIAEFLLICFQINYVSVFPYENRNYILMILSFISSLKENNLTSQESLHKCNP